jgi:hypothetical protein
MTQDEVKALEVDGNKGTPLQGLATKNPMGTLLTQYKKQVLVGVYDFSVLGGAVGSVNLKDAAGSTLTLPKGAIVSSGVIDVITAPTSGGAATIALTMQSAADLKAATAIASITGLVATIPVGSAATSIKLTADRNIAAVIATAALTAGKFNVIIEYYMPL